VGADPLERARAEVGADPLERPRAEVGADPLERPRAEVGADPLERAGRRRELVEPVVDDRRRPSSRGDRRSGSGRRAAGRPSSSAERS
jgi:hypothetical protein